MSNQEVENEALVGGSVSNVGLGIADATHYLHCTHCIGRSTKHYKMRCVVLKEMTNDRLKLLVFGEMYWSGREHIQRVRYVDADRVTKMSNVKLRGERRFCASPSRWIGWVVF
jgi:hypothetical protein